MKASIALALTLTIASQAHADNADWLGQTGDSITTAEPPVSAVLNGSDNAQGGLDTVCSIEHDHANHHGTPMPPEHGPQQPKRANVGDTPVIRQSKAMALTPGLANTSTQVEVPANSATINIPVTVEPGAVWMRVEIESDNGADVDLLVRGLQELGPDSGPEYFSAGNDGFEHVTITHAATPALRAGTWYLGIDNTSTQDTTVTVDVTVSSERIPPLELLVDYNNPACDNTSGWSDSTPVTAEGGNAATTLGAARRNAFERTLELLGEEIRSPVPVRVQACWDDLGSGDDGTTLAQAGPTRVVSSTPGLRENGVWYAAAPAVAKAGTDYCRFVADSECDISLLRVTFNDQIDQRNVGFYYGFDSIAANNPATDFIGVALHEMAHGLGFLGLVDFDDGSFFQDRADIYAAQAIRKELTQFGRDFESLLDMSDAERLDALTSNSLRWAGPHTLYHDLNSNFDPQAQGLLNAFPLNTAELHAPGTIQPGSSFSHFANSVSRWGIMAPTAQFGTDLRTLGLARLVLADVGWSETNSHIPSGLYFDPSLNGHGFDLYRTGASSAMIFYTFDEAGRPEWRLASASERNQQLASESFRFTNIGDLASVAIDDGMAESNARLTLSDYRGQDICSDNDVARDPNAPLFVLEFTTPGSDVLPSLERYCVQPFNNGFNAVSEDFTGTWFDASEPGWGLSLQTLRVGDRTDVVAIAYYFDAAGNPRWAIGQAPFTAEEPVVVPMTDAVGYGRGQAPVELEFATAGELILTLNEATAAADGGAVTVDLEYQGADGGSFQRTEVPIRLIP